MRENEGHLFVDAGYLFQSYCVKCGMVVDWMKVQRGGVTVPKCTYQYSAPLAQEESV